MPWNVVNFGKYQGKTLPQIALTDPVWFFWAFETGIFRTPGLKAEAKDIYRKATQIRVREPDPSNWKVEYTFHPSAGKLGSVTVVPANQPAHVGTSQTLREDHFDLSMARQIAPYDKLGGSAIVRALKFHVFGKSEARLTRKRCEQFFDDDSNFAEVRGSPHAGGGGLFPT